MRTGSPPTRSPAAAGARRGGRRALGVAADVLGLRERRGPRGALGAGWRRRWSSGMAAGCAGGRDASRSTWTRPTTRRMACSRLTFFNGHYNSWCYPPLLAFVAFYPGEVERYLCAAVLRAEASDGTPGVLCQSARAAAVRVSQGPLSRPAQRRLCDAGGRRSSTSSTPSGGSSTRGDGAKAGRRRWRPQRDSNPCLSLERAES